MDHHAPSSHDPAQADAPPAWEPSAHHHPIHHDPPPGHHDPPGYHDGPDGPPPSYDDAMNPLLGGVPPTYDYGTWQARDDSSTASTDIATSESGLHEWVGQFVVISIFVATSYGFWSLLNSPPDGLSHFPGFGPDGRPHPS